MNNKVLSVENLRILSQIFTPPTFNKIVREDDYASFSKKINAHYKGKVEISTNYELIKRIYKSLSSSYRCEYIYKNKLFIDIVKNYGLKETVVFNEFKIGSSKADIVLLNGSIRVYEIKTELDNLTKLDKQISDYLKIADKVYIVVDFKLVDRLIQIYKDTNIGIIGFSESNELTTFKEAESNVEFLEFDKLFKLLRKEEYLEVFADNFGYIPNIPNTKIFKFCYEQLKTCELKSFQCQVLNVLKRRQLKNAKFLKSKKTPNELKFICNSLDFNEIEYNKLYDFLNNNNRCIYHI